MYVIQRMEDGTGLLWKGSCEVWEGLCGYNAEAWLAILFNTNLAFKSLLVLVFSLGHEANEAWDRVPSPPRYTCARACAHRLTHTLCI